MVENTREQAHDLDVTVWVGKAGVEPVADELADQVRERELVKVRFLRAARGEDTTGELAADLAERAGVDLHETRGNTAVFY